MLDAEVIKCPNIYSIDVYCVPILDTLFKPKLFMDINIADILFMQNQIFFKGN